MIPSKVQHNPEGAWFPWMSGGISSEMFHMKLKEANGKPVYINGCLVFALRFENGQEWNTVSGFK